MVNKSTSEKLTVLDLFSGIGGFSLGLERTGGFETVAFCEIDKKAQLVLKKHWPTVPIHGDITTLKGDSLGSIDVICGGFPCQDISTAGKGAGLAGERSGLWFEYLRLIKEIKPKYCLIENVSSLRTKGLEEVLQGINEIGYIAEWHCIPASYVGAPHQRDRIWIVAYPNSIQGGQLEKRWSDTDDSQISSGLSGVSGFDSGKLYEQAGEVLADTPSIRLQGQGKPEQPVYPAPTFTREAIESEYGGITCQWSIEPAMGRVANGVPNRVDRLKQLGNAVVPQIPELLGWVIYKHYKDSHVQQIH